MTEESTLLKAFWDQGIDALLSGDGSLAQDIWMSAMLECQVDEVDNRTKELVTVLETTAIKLLQAGNHLAVKRCYDVALGVDTIFQNFTVKPKYLISMFLSLH